MTGVQQNITALYDHSFYCKVLPYVLSVTHFIMHYPVRHNTERITAQIFSIALAGRQRKAPSAKVGLELGSI